jgi:hypothetical protein
VSLTVAIIVIVALVLALFAALAFVMSRPKGLRAHEHGHRRMARLRFRRGHRPEGQL